MNELREKIIEHRAKVFNLAQEHMEHGSSPTTDELIELDNAILDAVIAALPTEKEWSVTNGDDIGNALARAYNSGVYDIKNILQAAKENK